MPSYPATLTIDEPATRDRLSVGFRPLLAVPIVVVLALLAGTSDSSVGSDEGVTIAAGGVGTLFFPVLLMLLFRRKYPGWWFDWNLAYTRFGTRVVAYLALLTDQYPSTDEEQSVHVAIETPDATRLNRWLPLVKWLLAIPHYLVLIVLTIGAILAVIVAWFAILFTGRYPAGLYEFVTGVMRWSLRVNAYAFLLTTDRYPPFTLRAET